MNFTDAVRQSMEAFIRGKIDLAEIQKTQEGVVKYTPDYFDALEEDLADMPEEDATDED